jgi:hypothetical protein
MGQAFPLTLGQRGHDARAEAPRSPPQRFYAPQHLLSPPALLPCPPGGARLGLGNDRAWDTTGQRRARVLAVASRAGPGPPGPWAGARRRLRAAQAPRRALPGAPSGAEVGGRLAGGRQAARAPDRERPPALAAPVRLSASPVGELEPPGSLALLACPARQPRARLAPGAQAQGGVRSARAGRAPPGGEPPMGGIRARTSGVI